MHAALIVGQGLSVPRHNVRLREFVPACSRATTTFDDLESTTLADAGIAPAKVMLLETRAEGKVMLHCCPV